MPLQLVERANKRVHKYTLQQNTKRTVLYSTPAVALCVLAAAAWVGNICCITHLTAISAPTAASAAH
jgi:asparagine N-glycosylation enzyme membrane subunit Stt3